jgi:hypothetical protein
MREPKASEKVVVEAGERGPGRGGEQLDRAVDSPRPAVEATVVLGRMGGDGVPDTPSRNEGITTCQRCGRGFVPIGRQLWCSAACRVAAWRQRHAPKGPVAPLPPRGQRRTVTVYVCDDCDTRALGEQLCSECNRFMRAAGVGGLCPCCEEPVAVAELVEGSLGQ